MAAKKNEQHPLRIEGYGSAGEGVARLEGQAVFVKGALAGEVCQVQLLKVGKSAAWGRVTQVLTPVPGRQSPDCPRYPRCGGCQLRHMTYAEELRFKQQKVQDALQRIGGWTGRVEKIHGAEAPDRYRNKIQFPVADGPRVGFFRARSHEVIDAEDCLLQPLAATRLREAFKLWMERYQVPAYDERVHGGLIRHFYVRVNRRGQSLCAVIANGTDLLHQEELVQALRRAETVLDLYCGIGTITLVMARQAGRAIGAEVIPAAVEDAKANAARNGVTNAEFLCADAAQAAQTLADRGLRPDVICVDPPRKGLAPAVIDAIVQMAPQRLVYVSCDPATLARDVKRMEEQGYVLQRAEAVDLFPRTAHVETVCLLSKLNTKQHIEVELN